MLLVLLAAAVTAGVPAPAGAGPPSAPAAATAPAAAPPGIDSLLQAGASGQTTDTDEDAAPPAPPPGAPFSELGGKSYDDALRAGAVAGHLAEGPLDGGWTLAAAGGRGLYRFQFVDHGGFDQAQGAWRDLDGGPRPKGSGFVDQVAYAGDQLMLRFYESGAADEVLVTIRPSGRGTWSGQLRRRGAVTPVTLKRD